MTDRARVAGGGGSDADGDGDVLPVQPKGRRRECASGGTQVGGADTLGNGEATSERGDGRRRRTTGDREVLLAGGVLGGQPLHRVDGPGERGGRVLHDGEAGVADGDDFECDGRRRDTGDGGDGPGEGRGGRGAATPTGTVTRFLC